MRVLALFLLVLLVASPACLGRRSDGGSSAPPATGVVEGDVLDEAGQPIPGVTVRVLATDQSATTAADGSFAIADVPAGPVRLVATKDGYSSATRSGVLDAGTNLRVTFLLREVARLEPRHETITRNGVVACGLPQGSDCSMVTGSGNSTHPFEVEPGLAGLVFEVQWTPAASGAATELALDVLAAGPSACGAKYAGGEGPSVLKVVVQSGFPISGGDQCAHVRAPADALVVQQAYTIHITLFYHAPPPDGFSALG